MQGTKGAKGEGAEQVEAKVMCFEEEQDKELDLRWKSWSIS